VFALIVSSIFTAIFTAGSVCPTALLALRLGTSPRTAMLSALAFAFGTVAWVYSRDFFAEPLLAFLTVATLTRAATVGVGVGVGICVGVEVGVGVDVGVPFGMGTGGPEESNS
jgi:hypothetical protein